MAILIRYTIDDEHFYEDFMREKAYLDQNSRENWAKREKEEALQEGLKKGAKTNLLQNIKNLLKFSMDEISIKKALNCTDEQIKEAKAY